MVTRHATVDLAADTTKVALSLADVTPPSPAYFVDLTLRDAGGAVVDRNLYWLSSQPDVLDFADADWYHTPTLQDADLTGLQSMPMTSLAATATRRDDGDDTVVTVTLSNASTMLAFFTRVEIAASDGGDELVPVRWSDNDVSLRASESRTLEARLPHAAGPLLIRWRGWNVTAGALALSP